MTRGTKVILKTVSLTDPGEAIETRKSAEQICEERKDSRDRFESEISSQLHPVKIDRSTIIELTNRPYGRAVNQSFAQKPINTAFSSDYGNRFNFKPIDRQAIKTIYIADCESTALTECHGKLKLKIQTKYFAVNVTLQKVWDLRSESNCTKNGIKQEKLLDTEFATYQDLYFVPAYSQRIGALAYEDNEIEAICYNSVKNKDGFCLAIFEEKLLIGSKLQVIENETGKEIQLIIGERPTQVTS